MCLDTNFSFYVGHNKDKLQNYKIEKIFVFEFGNL